MRRLKYISLLVLAIMMTGTAWSQNAAPRIFFSDLTSGPDTGGLNNKGAWVTLYGTNFGTTQGTSSVTVGGGPVDNCPVWGAAYLWYQKITCQLGASAASGNIVVSVGGLASNGVPFTVRAGNIYFASNTSGSDSNNGSYAAPFKTLPYSRDHMAAGDILYLRAGTWTQADTTNGTDLGAVLNFFPEHSGTSGKPKAVVAYPGEQPVLQRTSGSSGCYGCGIFLMGHSSGATTVSYVTVAGLTLRGVEHALYSETDTNYIRVIGSDMSETAIHAAAYQFDGSLVDNRVFGNNIHNNGDGTDKAYAVYFGVFGKQDTIEVAWNSLHDNPDGKCIQVYGHNAGDTVRHLTIHDNLCYNSAHGGMVLGGSDGGTEIFDNSDPVILYNNVFYNNGAKGFSSISFGSTSGGTGAFKLWNNTFYKGTYGEIDNMHVGTIEMKNNVFYADANAPDSYFQFEYGGSSSGMTGDHNLFYGKGVGPSWLVSNVNADPQFAGATSGNFRLVSGSPGIDAGTALPTPLLDITGLPRPQGNAYDIGAYEYSTGTIITRPNPPTNLTVTVQ